MATEQRLIDANKAQAVLVNMAEHLMEAGNPEMAGAVGYAAEVIRKQRTVDAIEVVRCKDCKHYMTIHCICDGCCISDDWYCADGERRTTDVQ